MQDLTVWRKTNLPRLEDTRVYHDLAIVVSCFYLSCFHAPIVRHDLDISSIVSGKYRVGREPITSPAQLYVRVPYFFLATLYEK